nr:hypothetical protein [Tanacetum cinerariifolium]
MAAARMTTSQAVGRLSGWYGFGDDRTKQEVTLYCLCGDAFFIKLILRKVTICVFGTISFRDLHGGKSIHFSPENRKPKIFDKKIANNVALFISSPIETAQKRVIYEGKYHTKELGDHNQRGY